MKGEKKELKAFVAEKKEKKAGKWQNYKVSGDKLERLKRHCPKCGAGTFMAQHKDRVSCGTCGYSEKALKK